MRINLQACQVFSHFIVSSPERGGEILPVCEISHQQRSARTAGRRVRFRQISSEAHGPLQPKAGCRVRVKGLANPIKQPESRLFIWHLQQRVLHILLFILKLLFSHQAVPSRTAARQASVFPAASRSFPKFMPIGMYTCARVHFFRELGVWLKTRSMESLMSIPGRQHFTILSQLLARGIKQVLCDSTGIGLLET